MGDFQNALTSPATLSDGNQTLTVAANDVIVITARKQTSGSSKSIWWNGTLEIVWDY